MEETPGQKLLRMKLELVNLQIAQLQAFIDALLAI